MENKLIYGTMGIGGEWDNTPISKDDRKIAFKALDSALSIGIKTLDFADIYNLGKSEKIFGEYLVEKELDRSNLRIQSKVGIDLWSNKTNCQYNFSHDYIISQVKKSVENLKTNYLDILLLHRMDLLINPEELKNTIDYLFNEGLIKDIGVSNMSYSQIMFLEKFIGRKIKVNQLEMSLYKNDFLESSILINSNDSSKVNFPHGTIEYCILNNIELQAYGPLAQGLYIKEMNATKDSIEVLNTKKLLRELAYVKNTTVESIMLSWLMKPYANIRPVIGSSNEEHIKNTSYANEVNLTREEWYDLYIAARGKDLP